MHGKMRHQDVSFTAADRQSTLLHVIQHIDENTEVEIRRGKRHISQTGDESDRAAADQGEDRRRAPNGFLSGIPFLPQRFIFPNEPHGEQAIYDRNGKREQKVRQTRKPSDHAEGRAHKQKPAVRFIIFQQEPKASIRDKKEEDRGK